MVYPWKTYHSGHRVRREIKIDYEVDHGEHRSGTRVGNDASERNKVFKMRL